MFQCIRDGAVAANQRFWAERRNLLFQTLDSSGSRLPPFARGDIQSPSTSLTNPSTNDRTGLVAKGSKFELRQRALHEFGCARHEHAKGQTQAKRRNIAVPYHTGTVLQLALYSMRTVHLAKCQPTETFGTPYLKSTTARSKVVLVAMSERAVVNARSSPRGHIGAACVE